MKKLSYLFVCLLVSIALNAQSSYWQSGYEANFDNWIPELDENGEPNGNERPYGWHLPWRNEWLQFGDPILTMTPVEDRFGNERSACRVEATGITSASATWHITLRTLPAHWANQYVTDTNPLIIDYGDEFYYTFWAKSDVEGTIMYLSAEQLYDPASGQHQWSDTPTFKLTTEWQKYSFEDYAFMELNTFNMHIRANGVYYIDDIELNEGRLPEDPGPGNSISDVTSENVAKVISSTGGVEIACGAGKVSVYDIVGNRVVADHVVGEGNNFIPLTTKGLHILWFEDGTNKVMVKTVIK